MSPINAYDEAVGQVTGDQNPYDGVVSDLYSGADVKATVATQTAQPISPDQAAEAADIAKRTGLQPDYVLQNFDAIQKRLYPQRQVQALQQSPATKDWLSQSVTNAAIGKDDLPALTTFERIMHAGRNLAGAAGAGLITAGAGLYGIPEAVGDVTGNTQLAQESAQKAQYLQDLAARVRGPREGAGFVEHAIYSGVEGVGNMVPALIAGAVSGGVSLLATLGTTSAGETYATARQQGQTVGKSAAAGSIQGAIMVATDFIPAHRLLGDLAAKSGLIKTLAHQIVPSIAGFEVATVLQDLNAWAFLPANKEKTFADYLTERPSQAAAAAISAITAAGATTVVAHGTSHFIERLGVTAAESQTVKRAPEKAQEFIASAVKDSGAETLYAPIDSWTSYWQGKGLDPRAVATKVTGNPAAFDTATRTGEDLAIPTANYAVQIAPTEHNAFFANELRLKPDQMNAREAETFQQEFAKEQAQPTAPEVSTEPIRQSIVSQLEATGFERSTAESYAQLYEAAFQTLGQRAGVDPNELFQRYGLQIARPELDTLRPPAQTFDPTQFEQPFFHGSPYDFERFDLSKIGTGQGAQTFGHGLYFAENPNVAESYRVELSPHRYEVGGRPITAGFEQEAMTLIRSMKLKDAETMVNRRIAQGVYPEAYGEKIKAALRDFEGQPIEKISTGKLYQVDIPEEQVAKFLQWDKPFTEQTPEVQAKLKTAFPWIERADPERLSRLPASVIYQESDKGSPQLTSEALKDAGIPGIKYLDQGSRGSGVGTHNVVVFDDSIIKLTHKDGTPVTAKERQEFFQTLNAGGNEQPRGRIAFGADRQFNIDLLKGADLSTFAHESAHFYLEVMRDLAPQSEQIAKDIETIRQQFGEDNTAQHEGFAKSFEQYLMEGKAPSADLRGVFARFRAWLTGVYRSLKGLNVELSPEVRQVFDRLLASDEAIRQAEAEGDVRPLFTDAKAAGMTDEAFAKYRSTVADASARARIDLEDQAMRAVQRERQAWWNAEKEQVAETVRADLAAQPVYQAIDAIKNGVGEGESREPLKLSKESLSHYDPDTLKALRRFDAYRVDGGVDVNTAAQMLGFSSGDELVQALKGATPLNQAVEAEAQRRMVEKHGDVLLDGSLADKATEAVFSNRDKVVTAELAALAGAQAKRGVVPPASVLRSLAEQRIGSTRVRDLKPGLFLMAAQRASQKAFDLLSTNEDRAGAVRAKQQELLNLALYREALKAREFSDDARDYLGPYFDKTTTRERIGKAGGGYLDQIDALRDRYEFARVTNQDLNRRASLAKFVESEQAQGHELAISPELLNEVRRTNYRDISIDELRGVYDGVKSIEHWARFKNRLLRAADQRELDALGADGSKSITDHAPKGAKVIPLEPRLPGAESRRQIQALLIAHRPLQALLRQLDGFTDGFFFDHVWRPAHEARVLEQNMGQDAAERFTAIHDARFRGRESELYQQTPIPGVGSLSTAARLVVALNYGNEGNRERLIAAGVGNSGPLTEPKIRAILDTLTADDWKYVKDTADLINSYKPQIGALYKRVTGVAPTWVEPTPFTTNAGDMPGWYYPIAYEGRASARALPGPEASFADIIGKSSYMKFTTANGHTEARTAHTGIPLRADLGVVGEHLQQVIHDLTHREMLIDVGRVLGRKEIQQAIYEHYGDLTYKEIQSAFRDIAIGPLPPPDWYRTIGSLRQGYAMARLAWNFATITRHVTNITNGMVRVGWSDVAKAIPAWLGSAKDAENSVAWIQSQSDLMNNRWAHRMEELASIKSDIGLNRGKYAAMMRDAAMSVGIDPDITHRFADSYLYGIHKVIQMAEIPTWIAAYRKAIDLHPDDKGRAIASADAAILDAFGGGDVLDQAGVQRSYGGKLFTTFMTYALSLHRQNYEILSKDESVGRKVMDATLLNIVPVMLLGSIFHQVHKRDSWTWSLLNEAFAHTMGMVVGLREISTALQRPDYWGPASTAVFGTATKLIYQTASALRSEDVGKLTSAAKSAGELAGGFYGVPVYQIEKTAEGLMDVFEGKGDLSEIFFGRPPKQAKR